jgi:hypothetical protein
MALGACRGVAVDPPGAATSPQANAEPAPLANVSTAAGETATTNSTAGATPPEPLRSDRSAAGDAPRETGRDLGARDRDVRSETRELAGYAMQAVLHAGEGPAAPRSPEVSTLAIEAARRKLEARLTIESSQTRARFVPSGGFVLPPGLELRARADRYGYILLAPGEDTYRIVEPGALRALFGERRLDVAPLSAADAIAAGDGARRLNLRTRRMNVTTRAAKATLELATFAGAGDGGGLLCRFLLDLVGAPPSTAACATDEIPLHAELRWTTQGVLVFDATSLVRRADLPPQELAAPPPTATFSAEPLPGSWGEPLLGKNELLAFRNAPLELPPAQARDAQALPPDAGLILVNSSDELCVAWVDGVPVAWVAPGGRVALSALVRGRYALQWRTFLGDAWTPPETIVVPGVSDRGSP